MAALPAPFRAGQRDLPQPPPGLKRAPRASQSAVRTHNLTHYDAVPISRMDQLCPKTGLRLVGCLFLLFANRKPRKGKHLSRTSTSFLLTNY